MISKLTIIQFELFQIISEQVGRAKTFKLLRIKQALELQDPLAIILYV